MECIVHVLGKRPDSLNNKMINEGNKPVAWLPSKEVRGEELLGTVRLRAICGFSLSRCQAHEDYIRLFNKFMAFFDTKLQHKYLEYK